MPDTPTPSRPSLPDSPLVHHLVSQLTVIKAQAQLVRRRMLDADPGADPESVVASHERAFHAIDLAVDQAMWQILIAARAGRMPLEPLDTKEDVA